MLGGKFKEHHEMIVRIGPEPNYVRKRLSDIDRLGCQHSALLRELESFASLSTQEVSPQ